VLILKDFSGFSPKNMIQFDQLGLDTSILRALAEEGYVSPTAIQQDAIPHVLAGSDVLACAQTGTGKTAAFAIPMLQRLSEQRPAAKGKHIRGLIVTPTRELAIQIGDSLEAYGRYIHMHYTVIFGGVNQHAQVQTLRKGVDILVATPGRLLDLMHQGFISLQHIEFFVLDEADRMLDMGFIHDVRKIVAALPAKRQSLFFSATMPPEIQKLAETILVDPKEVKVHPVSSTVEIIKQEVFHVDRSNKPALLMHLLEEEKMPSVLVFTRTKHGADKLVKVLLKNDIKAEAIHGNKAQQARQRALNNFKSGATRVLVATDIAARGIDVDELQFVINYEITNVPETYVHRIGRTGRAGASGSAYSFCEEEELAYVWDIEKLIKQRIDVRTEHPFPPSFPTARPLLPTPKVKESTAVNRQKKRHFRRPVKPA
jgi:ATP-dependent RNA helicase RhlE